MEVIADQCFTYPLVLSLPRALELSCGPLAKEQFSAKSDDTFVPLVRDVIADARNLCVAKPLRPIQLALLMVGG
jgi:hypothetical protein